MKCVNCGAELDKDSTFCTECGAKCETENSVSADQTGYSEAVVRPASKPNRKPVNKKILAGVGAGIVAVIVLICVLVSNANTINLNKYLKVTFSGYDGYGYATATFDKEKFEKDYGEKLNKKLNVSSKNVSIWDFFGSSSTEIFLRTCVDGDLDETNGLSNGDEIMYEWDCDDEKAKQLGFKLKHKDKTFKVSDLEEIGTFDAFEGVEIKFDDASPRLRASLDLSNSKYSDIYFDLDKTADIANGDKLTISVYAYGDLVETCIREYGMVPESEKKEIEVSGQPVYVTSSSDISESAMEAMKAQGVENMKAHADKYFDEYETLVSVDYEKSYFLNTKTADRGIQNYMVLVYKITVKQDYTYSGFFGKKGSFNNTTTYYWPLIFTDLKNDSEQNTIVNLTKTESFSSNSIYVSSEYFKSWSYNGFESIDKLYEKVIANKLESYTCTEGK